MLAHEFFKPIFDKHAEVMRYYVVYSENDPDLNVLLYNKICCDSTLLYTRVKEREWSIGNF